MAFFLFGPFQRENYLNFSLFPKFSVSFLLFLWSIRGFTMFLKTETTPATASDKPVSTGVRATTAYPQPSEAHRSERIERAADPQSDDDSGSASASASDDDSDEAAASDPESTAFARRQEQLDAEIDGGEQRVHTQRSSVRSARDAVTHKRREMERAREAFVALESELGAVQRRSRTEEKKLQRLQDGVTHLKR